VAVRRLRSHTIGIDSLSIMGSTISLKPSMPPSTPRRWADQPTGRNLVSTAVDWLFRGIDSERGIAWRAADSLALRDFLGVGLECAPLDHSTISRTRRLIDLETHRAVFTWGPLESTRNAPTISGSSIFLRRIVGVVFMGVNSKCAHQVRPPHGRVEQTLTATLSRHPNKDARASLARTPYPIGAVMARLNRMATRMLGHGRPDAVDVVGCDALGAERRFF